MKLAYVMVAMMIASVCAAADLTVHIQGADGLPAPDLQMYAMRVEASGFEYVAIQSLELPEKPAGTIRFTMPAYDSRISLRVSSTGHVRHYSDPIPTRGGDAEMTIRLRAQRLIKGQVPEAAGGEVMLLNRYDDVNLNNGKISSTWTRDRFPISADGTFAAADPGMSFWLFVTCAKGYALEGPFEKEIDRPVTLLPWKQMRGQVEANAAGPETVVDASYREYFPDKRVKPTIDCDSSAKPDPDGKYAIKHMVEGVYTVTRSVGGKKGDSISVKVAGSEVAQADFQRAARISLRVITPEEAKPYRFKPWQVDLRPSLAPLAGPTPPEAHNWKRGEWETWADREEVRKHPLYQATKALIASNKVIKGDAAADGALTFENVPDGAYWLSGIQVRIPTQLEQEHRESKGLMLVNVKVLVSGGKLQNTEGNEAVITAEFSAPAAIGDAFHSMTSKYVDGRPFSTSAFAGKTIVLIVLRPRWEVELLAKIDAFAGEFSARQDIVFVPILVYERRPEALRLIMGQYQPKTPLVLGDAATDRQIQATCGNPTTSHLTMAIISPEGKFLGVLLTEEKGFIAEVRTFNDLQTKGHARPILVNQTQEQAACPRVFYTTCLG